MTGESFVNLSDFSNSSINIQVIYFVDIHDEDRTSMVKEAINLRIMEIVEENGCRFAMPMQPMFMKQ